jgi:hypothetical protein
MKLLRIATALLVLLPLAARAAGPEAPCDRQASPAYAALNMPPTVALFHASDLQGWQPAACTGWPAASRSKLVIAVAGSFRFAGSIDALLARVAAVSSLARTQYWSTTDKKWRPIAYSASALRGPDPKTKRADFSASELSQGADLYYWDDDSRSGEIVTRMTVRQRTADRAVIATENITPIRQFLITLFPPRSLQTVMFVQRVAPGVWGVYLLSRTSDEASMLAGGHEASYVNRAVAVYRQVAGIRTDAEPPASP